MSKADSSAAAEALGPLVNNSTEDWLHVHPADIADRLQRMPPEEASRLLRELPPEIGARALMELDEDAYHELAAQTPLAELARLLGELPPNVVADLVGQLPEENGRELLNALSVSQSNPVSRLLRYPADTAGGIMSDRFIALRSEMTIEEARTALRAHAEEERVEEVGYLYVTDAEGRLVGVVSLRDLVFRRSDRKLGEILNPDVRSLNVEDDQETIARQFEHYHYLGLPVVDREKHLLGVVKASDALEIAQQEATEDMQLMVGLSGEERVLTPWHKAMGKRLPWLYVNLATAFLAAAVISYFESTIARWTALAVFLPIIAGQGGNAGMQTLTIVIRDLALGELPPGEGRRALTKELLLGVVNGLAIGIVVGLVGWWWKGSPLLGFIAGGAMLLNQLAAAASGVVIPLGLRWLRIDPALASSIFLTTVTDVAGFFFFLGLAALALRWAGF